jgi:hypothetical protein
MYINEEGLSDHRGDEPSAWEVEVAMKWLQEHAHPGIGWTRKTSRDLKFDVMLWSHQPVSNGAFIEAARRLGYDFKPAGRKSPYAVFRMLLKPNRV